MKTPTNRKILAELFINKLNVTSSLFIASLEMLLILQSFKKFGLETVFARVFFASILCSIISSSFWQQAGERRNLGDGCYFSRFGRKVLEICASRFANESEKGKLEHYRFDFCGLTLISSFVFVEKFCRDMIEPVFLSTLLSFKILDDGTLSLSRHLSHGFH